MGDDKHQRQIELLKILAKGCKKHPAYRAIRNSYLLPILLMFI